MVLQDLAQQGERPVFKSRVKNILPGDPSTGKPWKTIFKFIVNDNVTMVFHLGFAGRKGCPIQLVKHIMFPILVAINWYNWIKLGGSSVIIPILTIWANCAFPGANLTQHDTTITCGKPPSFIGHFIQKNDLPHPEPDTLTLDSATSFGSLDSFASASSAKWWNDEDFSLGLLVVLFMISWGFSGGLYMAY